MAAIKLPTPAMIFELFSNIDLASYYSSSRTKLNIRPNSTLSYENYIKSNDVNAFLAGEIVTFYSNSVPVAKVNIDFTTWSLVVTSL